MKGLATFAASAGLLWACSEGLTLSQRTNASPKVVGFPVVRKSVPNPLKRDQLRRRSGTVQATLDNEETLYFANATLGTPAQTVRLHIDTGSSDLWVNTATSDLCTAKGKACTAAGTYSANDSSTYSYIASDFNITYVDGSGASGDYVTDNFTLGSTTLKTLQFGIGYTSSSAEGILGIGYQLNEVQVQRAGKSAYLNLPAQLVSDGLISSNAYSLWLNDLDASTGSILFGGVDTDQFQGTLATLPIQSESGGQYGEFLLTLTGLSLGDTVIAKDQAQAVLMDSGSSLTYLPDAMAEAIYDQVSAQYDSQEGAAYIPCSMASNSTTVGFTFSSPTIQVSMDELVIEISSSSGKPLTFSDGERACLFGIAPAGSSTPVLGDTFIRSAYLVYDLANNEISIAQTNFNATSNNVVEITTGTAAVPSATVVQNPVTATAGATNEAMAGTVTLGAGGTATATSKAKSGAKITMPPMKLTALAVSLGMLYAAM
ncbi:putative aspartic-type endopeptidase [Lachnellula hyalina]|uniref:Probable aspartic-type endopeptidase OPSB n=1 Tax=Lachnellula hyalina TaxID=1316788 RepID=A0A8H8U0J3_9HELO|nr:putative aspartic-type endopeptidase [Lachnellula hyalina]TVY26096.1 putative aspartic-type endopeptidase [Lachnellula hyalina]